MNELGDILDRQAERLKRARALAAQCTTQDDVLATMMGGAIEEIENALMDNADAIRTLPLKARRKT